MYPRGNQNQNNDQGDYYNKSPGTYITVFWILTWILDYRSFIPTYSWSSCGAECSIHRISLQLYVVCAVGRENLKLKIGGSQKLKITQVKVNILYPWSLPHHIILFIYSPFKFYRTTRLKTVCNIYKNTESR